MPALASDDTVELGADFDVLGGFGKIEATAGVRQGVDRRRNAVDATGAPATARLRVEQQRGRRLIIQTKQPAGLVKFNLQLGLTEEAAARELVAGDLFPRLAIAGIGGKTRNADAAQIICQLTIDRLLRVFLLKVRQRSRHIGDQWKDWR